MSINFAINNKPVNEIVKLATLNINDYFELIEDDIGKKGSIGMIASKKWPANNKFMGVHGISGQWAGYSKENLVKLKLKYPQGNFGFNKNMKVIRK